MVYEILKKAVPNKGREEKKNQKTSTNNSKATSTFFSLRTNLTREKAINWRQSTSRMKRLWEKNIYVHVKERTIILHHLNEWVSSSLAEKQHHHKKQQQQQPLNNNDSSVFVILYFY